MCIRCCRQSRSADRFTERLISREKTKSLRERRTPTPTGLTGKFSSVFSKFESDNDKGRGRKSASPLTTRSKSLGPPLRRNSEKSTEAPSAVADEVIKPTSANKSESSVKPASREERKAKAPALERTKAVEQSVAAEPKAKKVERSKTFDTGVPSRAPTGSKVLDRMAKFGQSMDIPSKSQQTVTTRNVDTERFERHTIGDKKARSSPNEPQPRFDVDIHISREPLDNGSSRGHQGHRGTKTAAITVGRDRVNVEQLERRKSPTEERREEYLNVWDTEVPVTDGNKKVGSCPLSAVLLIFCLRFMYAPLRHLPTFVNKEENSDLCITANRFSNTLVLFYVVIHTCLRARLIP